MYCKFFITLTFCIAASLIDARKFIIPDFLTAGLFLVSFLIKLLFFREEIIPDAAAAVLVFLIFILIRTFNKGIGTGDIKFISVLCFSLGFFTCIFGCLFAAVTGLLYIFVKRLFYKQKIERIPFAPFLSIGALGCYFPVQGLL